MRTYCVECSARIIGRSDKKYCSSICRSAANNRNQNEEKEYIRNVNARLHRNRIILSLLYKQKNRKVTTTYLLSRGFSLSFFTMQKSDHLNRTVYYCYDYAYTILANDNCLISKIELFQKQAVL